MSEGSVRRYPGELRSHAVRMAAEVRHEYPSEWAVIESVASRRGIGTARALLSCVRKDHVDAGQRPGMSSEMADEVRQRRAENRELERGKRNSELGRRPR